MPIIPIGGTRDMRAEVLPPQILPLFDEPFVQSCDLLEEYVGRLATGILRELGLEKALPVTRDEAAGVEELVERLGLDPAAATSPLRWLLELTASRGAVEVADDRYRLDRALPEDDPAEIRDRQEAHDPAALPSYDIAAFAAESYPPCLRGEISGERALFAPQRLAHWSRYFSNDNPLYAINNRIPAMAAATEPAGSILELGGGLGSGGLALLGELTEAGHLEAIERYRFTDISPVFLRRGQRSLEAAYPELSLEAGRLDIDRPFADQRIESGAFDLVFSVNTVHVARDLSVTLGQIRDSLRPGGRLVLGEGIRPFAGQAIYSELVFLLLESFRSPVLHKDFRPTGGFLTPENWQQALLAAGFEDIELLPDIQRVREHYPSFLVAAISARRG